jgi:hypothetical protein
MNWKWAIRVVLFISGIYWLGVAAADEGFSLVPILIGSTCAGTYLAFLRIELDAKANK